VCGGDNFLHTTIQTPAVKHSNSLACILNSVPSGQDVMHKFIDSSQDQVLFPASSINGFPVQAEVQNLEKLCGGSLLFFSC